MNLMFKMFSLKIFNSYWFRLCLFNSLAYLAHILQSGIGPFLLNQMLLKYYTQIHCCVNFQGHRFSKALFFIFVWNDIKFWIKYILLKEIYFFLIYVHFWAKIWHFKIWISLVLVMFYWNMHIPGFSSFTLML